ncbi:MAG: hypothetical protein KGO02_11070 [Alphaproteobacteria bacterium]|nr:hypothetical protein [Alphaproteobacteria bacterium]
MSDRLSEWLHNDHAALSAALERTPLTDTVLARLARRQRREQIVLGVAVLAGMGLAAWQLPALKFLHLPSFGFAVPDASLLAGTLLIGATVAVFGWSLGER